MHSVVNSIRRGRDAVVGRTVVILVAIFVMTMVPQRATAQAGGAGAGKPPAIPDAMKAQMPGMNGKSPRIPTTFEELFSERDKRAIDALSYLRCLRVSLGAIQAGALGPVPRAWLLVCMEQNKEWRGVFVEPDDSDAGVSVRKQFALRGNGMVVTDAVDTLKVAGLSRALLRGLAVTAPGAGAYEFLPVPLPQPTFIEMWFLPVPNNPARAVTGGDSLIQMSSDGTRELGHSRTTPPIRTFGVAGGANYLLESREERIPLLSELMVVHMALSLAPDVKVRTVQYESAFSRSSPAVRHVLR